MATVELDRDGIPLLYTSKLLLAPGWVTFVTRVGVRVKRKALGMDAYLMGGGLICFTVTSSLCIVCSFCRFDQLAAVLPASTKMRGIKLFFIAEFFYTAGAVFVKYSAAVTLLCIANSSRSFVWTIWAIIATICLSAIVFAVGVANISYPIMMLWGETVPGSCNLKLNSDVNFFFSAIEILTDQSLAILPTVLLQNIQMKSKVKASVTMILGLAAFIYSDPAEFMFSTRKISLWSVIEEGIGIFAGSLPALRPLLSVSLFGHSGSSVTLSQPPSASAFK